MKLFGMKDRSKKKQHLNILMVLLGAVFVCSGCFGGGNKVQTKHVAAILRPSTEELEVERSRVWKNVENEAKRIKEEKSGRYSEIVTVYDSGKLLTVGEVVLFYDEIEAVLSSRKDLRLVDRNRIQDVIKEHEFALSSWSDTEKTAEIGKALNCDTLIFLESDEIFPVQDDYFPVQTVKVEFLDVNTFTKKVVVARKGRGQGLIDKWHKSERLLKSVDLD